MDARVQRRVQRYGWDLAADSYESLWQMQLADAQAVMLALTALAPGERVLDVACGTGLVSFDACRAVGPHGSVLGTDISSQMIEAARRHASEKGFAAARFERMDAECLSSPDASFDVVLCALGLMYMPEPEQALREMHRVLRPGGRIGLAVWGERARCGWAPLFSIVDAEVSSDVCPMFFRLGRCNALAQACIDAGFEHIEERRIAVTLDYADAGQACDAAFVGGPVAMAWSRFDEPTRARVRANYVKAIEPWSSGNGYRIPGEFVVQSAMSGARAAAGAWVR
jgi:ubiquinone/menaquinone biosynthesis C-methylase UbiE